MSAAGLPLHRDKIMLVGLDGIPLSEPKTGVGHYTIELARALAHCSPSDEFEIVSPRPFLPTAGAEAMLPANLRLRQAEVNAFTRHWWTIGLPRYIKKRAFTIFHGTNYEVPLRKRCPAVLTIHDLSLQLYPETHERRRVSRARRRLPLMVRCAELIITPTESVREEVCEHLRVSPERVFVVPEAPREIFRPMSLAETEEARRRLGTEDDFLLFVGTIEPRKNLRLLLRAFAEILSSTPFRPQLVIAGQRGWLSDQLFRDLTEYAIADRVLFTGYLSDEDLCALYSSCRAFVYPSLYEGFGLPPLEAMKCGAPVVASRVRSISEVTGGAALLFTSENLDELVQHLIRLLTDDAQRASLSSSGLARAAQFSWERTARLTLEVYGKALAGWRQK
ncbi:MAG TPA: glycosyltransferase family 1 protein [Pyrinomonadaceae bacterium]|jgi:glycosyltransferase involved in cell wall biosynthesis